jgi:hypothetical protein
VPHGVHYPPLSGYVRSGATDVHASSPE